MQPARIEVPRWCSRPWRPPAARAGPGPRLSRIRRCDSRSRTAPIQVCATDRQESAAVASRAWWGSSGIWCAIHSRPKLCSSPAARAPWASSPGFSEMSGASQEAASALSSTAYQERSPSKAGQRPESVEGRAASGIKRLGDGQGNAHAAHHVEPEASAGLFQGGDFADRCRLGEIGQDDQPSGDVRKAFDDHRQFVKADAVVRQAAQQVVCTARQDRNALRAQAAVDGFGCAVVCPDAVPRQGCRSGPVTGAPPNDAGRKLRANSSGICSGGR